VVLDDLPTQLIFPIAVWFWLVRSKACSSTSRSKVNDDAVDVAEIRLSASSACSPACSGAAKTKAIHTTRDRRSRRDLLKRWNANLKTPVWIAKRYDVGMALADITAAGVRRALAEFDELGRDAFLAKYGFKKARGYFLADGGNLYDSKAIAGAAHGLSGPERAPLLPGGFSGGEQTVAVRLEALGFRIARPSSGTGDPALRNRRNPKWADPELLLALDLYLREGILDEKDPRVVELSALLNRLQIHTDRPDAAVFRNANGVALKLANFAALDPSYRRKGMDRGGRRDAEIWELYSSDSSALHEAVDRIRAGSVAPGEPSAQGVRTVSAVPVEARNVATYPVEHVARTAAAERMEQQLVLDLRDYLQSHGHRIVRHKYGIDGGNLYCDMFDETDAVLVEAKGDVTRELVRMAIGQLLDYSRFYPTRPRLAVLLPRRPSDDTMQYLGSVGATLVYRNAESAWDYVGSWSKP
jgi:hypothetical protein